MAVDISTLKAAHIALKSPSVQSYEDLLGKAPQLKDYSKLFKKIWKLSGKPDYLDFGRHAFFNHYGHTTTNEIRLKAIDYCIKKLITARVQPSSYIFRHLPRRYSLKRDNQETYVFEVQKFIKELVDIMSSRASSAIYNDSIFFDVILSVCATKRAFLARNAESSEAHLFGALQPPDSCGLFTLISGYSVEYNRRIYSSLKGGGASSSLSKGRSFTGNSLYKEYKSLIPKGTVGMTPNGLIARVQNPTDYETIRLQQAINCFLKHPEISLDHKTTRYQSETRMITLGEKTYSLSTYLFNSEKVSPVYLMHTSPLLHKKLLKKASRLFINALKSSEDEETLLKKMAEFQYLLSHISPFFRGSAAICEWIEMAIFCSHGYKVSYKDETCMNLEALTLSLEEFVEKYPSFIKISKNNSSTCFGIGQTINW